MIFFLRSFIFNVLYYGSTILIGLFFLPSLLLPTRLYLPFIRIYFVYIHILEKYILGLDYQILGSENLPHGSRFIVASKHQSAYETLKLPILFNNPVVILKRELLLIPLWGWYAAKAGMIGIDRGRPRAAISQMRTGARIALDRGHTLVIFPQGTRTALTDTATNKPYKHGVYDLYTDLNVPVLPMALNAGVFWPRNAFLKTGGTVTLSFLPIIEPGLDQQTFMTHLQDSIETETNRLVTQVQEQTTKKKKKTGGDFFLIFGIFFCLYITAWFVGAAIFQQQADKAWAGAPYQGVILSRPSPRVSGFPGPYVLTWSGQIKTPDVDITAPLLKIKFVPLPRFPVTVSFPEGLMIEGRGIHVPPDTSLKFKELMFEISVPDYLPPAWTKDEVQKLYDQNTIFRLTAFRSVGPYIGDTPFIVSGTGTLSYDEHLQPLGSLELVFEQPDILQNALLNIVGSSSLAHSFVKGTMHQLEKTNPDTGGKTLPLTFTLKNGKIYAGPIKIGKLPRQTWPETINPSNRADTPVLIPTRQPPPRP